MQTTTVDPAVAVCARPGCGNPLSQLPGGHRRRRYCSDSCKQMVFRARLEEQKRQAVRERWADFLPETQAYLEWLMSRNDVTREFVAGIIDVIKRERREPLLSQDEAIAQARLHCYLGTDRYLESTERLFVELFRARGHAMVQQVATAINQERGHLRQAMNHLGVERDQVQKELDQALQVLKEREAEVTHLKTRIEKQYERRIAKQETHIQDLEGDLARYRQICDISNR